MKTSRLFLAFLFAFTLGLSAHAQESSEITSLRAKAERGNGIAQYNLGLAYAEGRGIAADPLEAFVWLSLARENGARGRALDSLGASFDRATLAVAQERLAARKAGSSSLVKAPAAPAARTETRPAAESAPAGPIAPRAPAAPPGSPGATTPETPAATGAPRDDAELARARSERDALSARLTDLSAELAGMRADRDRLVAQAAASSQAAREAGNTLQEQNRAAETRIAGLGRETEMVKTELERTKQALAALERAPKPAPDTAALDQKTRELQAALTELDTSRTFGHEVEATLNRVTDQKTALEAQLAALTKARDDAQSGTTNAAQEAAALKAQLAALTAETGKAKQEAADLRAAQTELNTRLAAAPAYPDLSGRVKELEAQLAASDSSAAAAAKAETENARQQAAALTRAKEAAAQQLAELGSLKSALEQNRTQLAASEQRATALNSRVAELEQQAARLADRSTAGAAAEKRVAEVTAELAALQGEMAQLRQKPAAPKYPDLRGRVKELESSLSDQTAEATRAKRELASTIQAKDEAQRQLAAKPVLPSFPDLRERVAALELELVAARTASPKYPDLRNRVGELESALAASKADAGKATQQIAALTRAKDTAERLAAAKPAYPDLSDQVRELEGRLAAARNTAPAYPDLRGRVGELEAQLAALRDTSENSGKAAGALKARLVERDSQLQAAKGDVQQLGQKLKQADSALNQAQESYAVLQRETDQLRQRPTAPSYPDLSAKVRELEANVANLENNSTAMAKELAETKTQLGAARNAAPSYPDLSGKVAELEGQLAAARHAAPAYPDLSGRVQ